MNSTLVSVDHFSVGPLHDLSFTIEEGEALGLVGPSGSGKSLLALSLLGLSPLPTKGTIRVNGKAAIVFQDSLTSLNPTMRIGRQIEEAGGDPTHILPQVGLASSLEKRYPHELSGGMRQRVAIAIAISLKPSLLILDEPTTALDPETQEEILSLLKTLQKNRPFALLLISHDPTLVSRLCTRVISLSPQEPPLPFDVKTSAIGEPLLEVRHLTHRVLHNLSFTLHKGETVALLGRSGAGKSTLARTLLRLEEPREGQILLEGTDLLKVRNLTPYRRKLQIVFQDPSSSLNPRMKVRELLREPLLVHKIDAFDRIEELLRRVGLSNDALDRYPHQFSGGQRQRIAIARALVLNPSLLVLDEPVSSLDVPLQRQVMGLLLELQQDLGLSYLLITHDTALAAHVADRILVLHEGSLQSQMRAPDLRSSLSAFQPKLPTL